MKALASRNRSWPTSAWSFFSVGRGWTQAGELVGDTHKLFGQPLESLVVGDQGFDLRGLVGGDPFRELLALDVALQNVVRTLLSLGGGVRLFEELTAEGATAKPVDGLHLLEDLVPALFELRKRVAHGAYCISTDTIGKQKTTSSSLVFNCGDFRVPHPEAIGRGLSGENAIAGE